MKKRVVFALLSAVLLTGTAAAADVTPIVTDKELPEGFALITAKNFNSLGKEESADSVYQDLAFRPAAYVDTISTDGSWSGMKTADGIHVDGYPATGNAAVFPRWLGGPKNIGTDNLETYLRIAGQGSYGAEIKTVEAPGVVWGRIWQPANSGTENASFICTAVTGDRVIVLNIAGASQAGAEKRVAAWTLLDSKQQKKVHPDRTVLTVETVQGILLKIIGRVNEGRIKQLEALIAAKRKEISGQEKDTIEWREAMRQANKDLMLDMTDLTKKKVLDMQTQRKEIAGQPDDTYGNTMAVKGYTEKAETKLARLLDELTELEKELTALRPPQPAARKTFEPSGETPRRPASEEKTYALPRKAKQ